MDPVTCVLASPGPQQQMLIASSSSTAAGREYLLLSRRSPAMNTAPDVEDGDIPVERPGLCADSDLVTRVAASAPPSYLQRDDDNDDDHESAYGEDSLLRDETKSLTSYMTEYRYEFGRRYHAFRDGAYWVRGVGPGTLSMGPALTSAGSQRRDCE